jgi:hypothetical protein
MQVAIYRPERPHRPHDGAHDDHHPETEGLSRTEAGQPRGRSDQERNVDGDRQVDDAGQTGCGVENHSRGFGRGVEAGRETLARLARPRCPFEKAGHHQRYREGQLPYPRQRTPQRRPSPAREENDHAGAHKDDERPPSERWHCPHGGTGHVAAGLHALHTSG